MERVGLRVIVLLVVSSGVGAMANAVRSKPLDWVLDPAKSNNPSVNPELQKSVELTADEFLEHVRRGDATFVDARNTEEYVEGHVVGAINIPAPKKEEHIADIMTLLPPDQPIIIYCGGGKCEASNTVFEFLSSFQQFKKENLRIFHAGWEFIGKHPEVPTVQGSQP